jgi:hypothetical protein
VAKQLHCWYKYSLFTVRTQPVVSSTALVSLGSSALEQTFRLFEHRPMSFGMTMRTLETHKLPYFVLYRKLNFHCIHSYSKWFTQFLHYPEHETFHVHCSCPWRTMEKERLAINYLPSELFFLQLNLKNYASEILFFTILSMVTSAR